MKVLLTGGSGFVGKHLAAQLDTEHLVFAPSSGDLDVRDFRSVQRAFSGFKPDLCIHLAAESSPKRAQRDFENTRAVNVQGVASVLEAAGSNCRVVLFSSCHVLGEPTQLPMGESHPTNGQGAYAQSKIDAEQLALQRVDREWIILRMFNLTGPGQPAHFAASDWAHQWMEGRRCITTGDLSLRRDYLDVRDACKAILAVAEKGRSRQTINICSGESVGLKQLFDWAAPGAEPDQDDARFRVNDVQEIRGCSKRIRSLGWSPQIPIKQSLADLREEISVRF
jgi:GDP-4-dehydro-6-deoxy-D-mannose reductase